MFTLIPLKNVQRASSFRIDNLIVQNGMNITGIFREIHGPKTKSSIGSENITKKMFKTKPNGEQEIWYQNQFEKNNLMVLNGSRNVDLYCPRTYKKENLIIHEDNIYRNGKLYYGSPAIISWSGDLFHKTEIGENGSFSLNIIEKNYVVEEITQFTETKGDASWTPYWQGGLCN
tara:strand:+ start:4464 stop:4985 length:522 start_codon:yes stop_codon:yes gene_type:complete